jgi:hypothetical protein
MRALIVCFLLLNASAALATCPRPGPAPEAPNGAVASDAEMKQGREAIQAFVIQLEAYQACLKAQVEQAPLDTPPELRATWLAQGDAALDAASLAANSFSAALKAFKARSTAPTN